MQQEQKRKVSSLIINVFIVAMLFFVGLANATPREIIIIRHADKLDQPETGPALSAQGVMRSIKFAFYFLDKFSEPDFIVAADDQKDNGKQIAIRSIQTVAPLANMMQIRNPKKDFPIIHPFPSDSYRQLADYLLNDERFNDKIVLICWSHSRIAKLTNALGVKQALPAWPREDYDTVYDLKFDSASRLDEFVELKNQFPTETETTWQGLRDKVFAS